MLDCTARMRARLAEIEADLSAAAQWGAKLTALREEREHLLRNLGLADKAAPVAGEALPVGAARRVGM